MALLIREAQVAELATLDIARDSTRRAHLALAAGTAVNEVRSRARAGRTSVHTMSAIDSGGDYAAAKVYTAVGQMAASHVLLYRASTGELLAIIEAVELGRLRTAAASVLAARALVSQPATTLGIVGCGFQAEGLLRAYTAPHAGFSFERVLIAARDKVKLQSFCQAAAQKLSLAVLPAESAEQLVRESQIVVTATTSAEPVLAAEWLKNVVHLSAVGANSLARREIPLRAVLGASAVVVDDVDVARAESGNLLPAVETGKLHWHRLPDLGALLAGQYNPPMGGTYSLFCSHGLAAQDLFLGASIYERVLST